MHKSLSCLFVSESKLCVCQPKLWHTDHRQSLHSYYKMHVTDSVSTRTTNKLAMCLIIQLACNIRAGWKSNVNENCWPIKKKLFSVCVLRTSSETGGPAQDWTVLRPPKWAGEDEGEGERSHPGASAEPQPCGQLLQSTGPDTDNRWGSLEP